MFKNRDSDKKQSGWLKRGLKIFLVLVAVLLAIIFVPRPAEKAIQQQLTNAVPTSDPAFIASVGHLVGAPLLSGNKVVELINGDQIFPAQLKAIRGAKKSICIENFIFRSGKLSAELVEALTERARAGVKVHMIMDSMGSSKLQQKEIDQLKQGGVEFIKYNRTEWHKLLRVNHRDHRKLLIVDGKIGFTGGACYADEWLGNGDNPKIWRDTHFQVEGPAVAQIQGVFMDNYIQTEHGVLHGPDYFPPLEKMGDIQVQCLKTGPKDGVETARLVYLYSIAAARKNIRISHSYFVPDDLMIETILSARKRGVKVEIITPGIIDANVVRRASRARWDELLSAGVEFYEFQPALLHCKIMIIDDNWVIGGTVNFDNRSFRLNDEDSLNIWDRDFAAKMIAIFEKDREKSRKINPGEFKARPWYEKGAEHFAAFFRAWL